MEQSAALSILQSGKNVFLTGSAGTGKTYVLNQYIQFLKDRQVNVAITASTGIAATHMRGNTIHSWSGIGIKHLISSKDLAVLSADKTMKKKMEKVKVLLIDEISMLHREQFDGINQILKHLKKTELPFGGLQLIVCGDFFQLPPVGKMGERSKDKFSFMSKAWIDAEFHVCYLTKQYRQNDQSLNTILNEIRSASISKDSMDQLRNSQTNFLNLDWEPTKLFTHNVDVDKMNLRELELLEGKKRYFKASTTGPKNIVESLKKSVASPLELALKVNSRVMFVKNNPEKGYVNGTIGTVIEYNDSGFPVVKALDGNKYIASPEKWAIDDEQGKALATFNQVPLRLAWAITVHKSQGMTLDSAEIDLSKTFEKGQGYVALSRLKNLDRLHLKGFNITALQVDQLAYKADLRFQELSEICQSKYSIEELDLISKVFVKASGGRVLKKLNS